MRVCDAAVRKVRFAKTGGGDEIMTIDALFTRVESVVQGRVSSSSPSLPTREIARGQISLLRTREVPLAKQHGDPRNLGLPLSLMAMGFYAPHHTERFSSPRSITLKKVALSAWYIKYLVAGQAAFPPPRYALLVSATRPQNTRKSNVQPDTPCYRHYLRHESWMLRTARLQALPRRAHVGI